MIAKKACDTAYASNGAGGVFAVELSIHMFVV